MNSKQRIQMLKNEQALLTFQQIRLEDEKVIKTKEIIKIQSECKHKFKTNAAYAGHLVECEICGYITGA